MGPFKNTNKWKNSVAMTLNVPQQCTYYICQSQLWGGNGIELFNFLIRFLVQEI